VKSSPGGSCKIPAKPHYLGWFLLCIGVYIAAVSAFGVCSHQRKKAGLLQEIDASLLLGAKSLKYMLAPDFHDRALGPDSIAFEEELRNRKAFADFWADARFKWVYTLVKKDGQFFFSGPAVSAEEARERRSWYFYPYVDVPREFAQALANRRTAFIEYTDHWGHFRSVALPQVSPLGRPYLACADLEISHVQAILRRNAVETALTVLFFLACSLPFTWLFYTHAVKLRCLNTDLNLHRDHLEDLVHQRTQALEEEQQKLRQALAEVKTLRGLVPICSSCKKIRDDQGFWNQLELYVEAHSNAEFTHGVCPDCARILYPEYRPDAEGTRRKPPPG